MIPYYKPLFEAAEAGYRAREAQQPRESNPHTEHLGGDSLQFQWWDSGWMNADEDIQEDIELWRMEEEDGRNYDWQNNVNC